MEEKIKDILLSFFVMIGVILSGFFFSITNITLEKMLTINIFPILEKIFTIEFLFFLIILSLTIAVILFIIKTKKEDAFIINFVGYFLGCLITVIFFNLLEFFVPLLFGLAGILIISKTQAGKEKEYKTMKTLRAGINSTGKIITLLAFGVMVFLLVITIPNASDYEEAFVEDFLKITVGENDVDTSIQESIIESTIEAQISTVEAIKSIRGFSKLHEKDDIDVITFLMNFENLERTLKSEEYKERVIAETIQKTTQEKIGAEMIEQIPLIKNIASFSWIIYPLLAFLIIIGIGNIIIKNVAGLIFLGFVKIGEKKTLEKQKF